MRKYIPLIAATGLTAALVGLVACSDDASVASHNLSKAADNFEITRRIVFYNGITDTYMLEIIGRCSVDISGTIRVTCKVGPDEFKKHYLVRSDNTTMFAEQLESADVSVYHHRVIFKPQSILPDIDFRGDAKEIIKNRN